MGHRAKNLLAVFFLILGLGLVLYPIISNAIFQYGQSQLANYQFQAAAQLDDSERNALIEQARNYNKTLLQGRVRVTDPFDPNAPRVSEKDYWDALNILGDGVMGSISIPKIGVNCPIYHGTSNDILQKGVGHVDNTSLPVGGESTHCVLAGHTGLSTVRIFDALERLEVGDCFTLFVLGQKMSYRVYDIEVVIPDDTSSLVVEEGRDLVTLVTCTPYAINSHRLLVHAERTDAIISTKEPSLFVSNIISMNHIEQLAILCIFILIIILVLIYVWRQRCVRKKLQGRHSKEYVAQQLDTNNSEHVNSNSSYGDHSG